MIPVINSLKLTTVLVSMTVLFSMTGFNEPDSGFRLVGVWESEEKDLQIEMFEDHGVYAGRMIYFKCLSDDVMQSTKDVENPEEDLRSRNLLGLKLVTELMYKGDGVWDDGKIYDPNSGNTFEARIQLTDPHTAIVRGYWKFRWLGRSMVFKRL